MLSKVHPSYISGPQLTFGPVGKSFSKYEIIPCIFSSLFICYSSILIVSLPLLLEYFRVLYSIYNKLAFKVKRTSVPQPSPCSPPSRPEFRAPEGRAELLATWLWCYRACLGHKLSALFPELILFSKLPPFTQISLSVVFPSTDPSRQSWAVSRREEQKHSRREEMLSLWWNQPPALVLWNTEMWQYSANT